MRILYLAHRIPYPPNKGDKIRAFHAIEHLARRHDVYCACFVDDPADLRYVAVLRQMCREVIALPLNRRWATLRGLADLLIDESASEGFYRDARMARALKELGRRVDFDAVLAFSSSMGQYAHCVTARRRVIDFCDRDSRKWAQLAGAHRGPKSWLLAAEARQLAALERRLHIRFDASVLIAPHEAEDWNIPCRRKLHFIGNGVAVPPLPDSPRYDSGVVGFVGDMRYPPNIDGVRWFVEQIWPRIRRNHPAAAFHIVGRHPTRAIRRLKATPGVHVMGEVADVQACLADFQLVVAPLRIARGVQNKVLEAMAAAKPVVAAPAAATGIDAAPGEHFYLAENEPMFALQVGRLLDSPTVCAHLGRAGRTLVENHYRWEEHMARLETLLAPAPTLPVKQTLLAQPAIVP